MTEPVHPQTQVGGNAGPNVDRPLQGRFRGSDLTDRLERERGADRDREAVT